MSWPEAPVIYEINTAVWLGELSRAAGRPVTLADIPSSAWHAVTPAGVDAVWLMGVWERSTLGLAMANAHPGLRASFHEALPDLRAEDVLGSPYCVRRYVVAEEFGGDEGLARARAELAARGVRLVLDYVPNHVAPDHPWVTEHPEFFVRAENGELELGRDPYFPAWPDVVQLDAFSPALRTAATMTLASVAARCDGIRCDMAMLVTNEVFARTWNKTPPSLDFWPEVIGGLRAQHPETVLIAEAYWDMEWALQLQGFNFCYDKRLYDRIVGQDVQGVRDHLRADPVYQSRLLRFLENQDEPRILSELGPEAAKAAALMIATLPGATLWHEGQFEGRRVRPPVFLARRPDEPLDDDLAAWYRWLLAIVADHGVRRGDWSLIEAEGWPDNQSCQRLLAWEWITADGTRHVVVVNFSGQRAQGLLPVGWQERFTDLLDGGAVHEPVSPLYVELGPWECHLFVAA
ncbi:alpha-amylase family glycosyl hydrolase [Lentzea sp. NPDC005914]|uniref:alpha-amylase family glycosyl hydrolase n=1 Tax=Lentzea sp. NPDC005914 TaxID=3154572 RepID=UPI0033D48735